MSRILTGILALTVAACGGGNGTQGTVNPPPVDTTPEITVAQVFTQLSFNNPTALKQAPGDSSRWFVGEQDGFIRVFANNQTTSSSDVFLDISGVTQTASGGGLLGFAFHPDFPVTPEAFVSYTRADAPLVSYISRFYSTDSGQTLLASSEEPVVTVLEPENNHNSADLTFGQDGYLYIGFGDGGGPGDPHANGQDDTNLHGTIVRIDVDGAAPYEIPPSNPNAANSTCAQGYGSAPCAEIFAWGFRNPWRLSFDEMTGKLWTGDVGQGNWEEINVVEINQNYGWSVREGAHCFDPAMSCSTAFTDPITEYDRGDGVSVTGGFVYRGSEISNLVGWYVFGDFGSGSVFAIPQDSAAGVTPRLMFDTGLGIVTFGQATNGELYLMDFGAGTIHKIKRAP